MYEISFWFLISLLYLFISKSLLSYSRTKILYLHSSLLIKLNENTINSVANKICVFFLILSKLNKLIIIILKITPTISVIELLIKQTIAKIRINNYKELASVYKLFEYNEVDNPKSLLECKTSIVNHLLGQTKTTSTTDALIETYRSHDKNVRLLAYKMLVDKFNKKYSGLNESQKQVLNKFITHVNDSESLKQYFEKIIPGIKKQLKEQVSLITDKATKIKVDKLSEMLCNVETIKVIKESHVLTILRYYDLIKELKQVNKWNHF